MKPIQLFTKWVIPPSLAILSSLSMTTNQAFAGGGYDEPDLLPAEEQVSKMRTLPAVLSWDKWEKPYVSGGDLCRHKNGDVICLPIAMAKKVGVDIYSSKKASISQTAKRK